jgi:hypothetical protein
MAHRQDSLGLAAAGEVMDSRAIRLNWKNGTHNRYKSTLSLIFRLGIEHNKISSNPARFLKRKQEDSGRVRFLDQFKLAKTETEYLQQYTTEESRLEAVINHEYPEHLSEFVIALHTGLRRSEQYRLVWESVDLETAVHIHSQE